MNENPPAGLDPAKALANILTILQEDPRRYRFFGVWWWHVKVMLRAAGYGADRLYLLGDFINHEQMRLTPSLGAQETLRDALAEYGENARFRRLDGKVETPEGGLAVVMDPDAGGF